MENVADLIHIIVTVASFVCFVLIGLWAYSKSAKPHFEEAANLFFQDDDAVTSQAAGKQPVARNGAKQ